MKKVQSSSDVGESVAKCGIPGAQPLVLPSHGFFDRDGPACRSYRYLDQNRPRSQPPARTPVGVCSLQGGCSVQSCFSRIREAMLVLPHPRTPGEAPQWCQHRAFRCGGELWGGGACPCPWAGLTSCLLSCCPVPPSLRCLWALAADLGIAGTSPGMVPSI